MSYYIKHIFICTNQRDADKKCCNQSGASEIYHYAKNKLKELNLIGKNQLRISLSGCLGRCAEGPVLVIYPEAIWYTYKNTADIDEIISAHLIGDKIVQHLLLTQ